MSEITNRTIRGCDRPPRRSSPVQGELLDKVGLTYPAVWKRMRTGAFPRAVVIGDKCAWLEHEVDAWIAALPRRRLKGDTDGVAYRTTPKRVKS